MGDAESAEQDAILKAAVDDLKLHEYWPALFSEVTVTIHRGHYDEIKAKIKAIDELTFTATIVQGV